MGIHNFKKLLTSLNCTGSFIDLNTFKVDNDKRVILIDGLNVYHKSKSSKGSKLKKEKPHIQGMLNLIAFLRSYGFIPVVVFDGKPPASKQYVIDSRKERYIRQLERIKGAHFNDENPDSDCPPDDENDKAKQDIIEKRLISQTTRNDIAEITQMLDLIGLPYIKHEEYEAEVVCAWLIANSGGKIAAAFGDDWDLLALGCPVYRTLDFREKTITFYDPQVIKNKLGLTQKQFIDLIMMIGNEHCDRIIGLEPIELYHILKMNQTLENSLKFIKEHYTSVKIPDIDYNYIHTKFDLPDIDFCNYIRNEHTLNLLVSHYNSIEDGMVLTKSKSRSGNNGQKKILIFNPKIPFKELLDVIANMCGNMKAFIVEEKIMNILCS
jgi:5'-3' exonuclease